MKTNQSNPEKLVNVPQKVLLSLVANKLKGRALFPQKVESIKQSLRNVEIAK